MEGMLRISDFSETSSAPETLDELFQESVKHNKVSTVAPVAHIWELQEYFQSALVFSEKADSHTYGGVNRMKIPKTYQPKRFALTDMKAQSSKNRSHISRIGLGNRHGLKYAKFKKKFSKILKHKVTFAGVTILIKEYLPGNDFSPDTVKTKENMKIKSVFQTLCSQIVNYNKDVIYNFTVIDVMSASYRKCQPSVTFFEEKNSMGPFQLKSHIQDFREEKISIWESKKNAISKNVKHFDNHPPHLTLKYPLPKLGHVIPSVMSCLYGIHSEITAIEKKMTECLSIKTKSENYELNKIQSRNDNILKNKSYNREEFEWGCLELDSNVYNYREFTTKEYSKVKFINSKSYEGIFDKGLVSEKKINIKEAPSVKTYEKKIKNDDESFGKDSNKEILLYSKNGDDIVEIFNKNVYSKLHANEYSNIIVNEDNISMEVSEFVLDFDSEKKDSETKLHENYGKKSKNDNELLGNNIEKEILFYSKNGDNIVEKCNKNVCSKLCTNECSNIIVNENTIPTEVSELLFLDFDSESLGSNSDKEILFYSKKCENTIEKFDKQVYSKLHSNEYSNIIVDEDENPMDVSEFVFWDFDSEKKDSETKLNETETEYSSEITLINDVSGHRNSAQSLGIFDKHSKLVSHSSYVLDRNESLQNQNGGPNNEYKYDVPTKVLQNYRVNNHYHCFSMETNSQVPSGAYDPITESWREVNLKEDLFDGNCFSMETNNQVPSGVYDSKTEGWRKENLKEDLFDEKCKQRDSEEHLQKDLFDEYCKQRDSEENLKEELFEENFKQRDSEENVQEDLFDGNCKQRDFEKKLQEDLFDKSCKQRDSEENIKEDLFDENCNQRDSKSKRFSMQNGRISENYRGAKNLAKVICNLLRKIKNDYGDDDKAKANKKEQSRLALTLEMLGLFSASQFVASQFVCGPGQRKRPSERQKKIMGSRPERNK